MSTFRVIMLFSLISLVLWVAGCKQPEVTTNTPTTAPSVAPTNGTHATNPGNSTEQHRVNTAKMTDEQKAEMMRNIPQKMNATPTQEIPVQLMANRPLINYYKFLTNEQGLKASTPREFPGGPRMFMAEDVIQFTLPNPQVAVIILKFKDEATQTKAGQRLNMIAKDRSLDNVGNYTILIQGGDDKLHKLFIDALEKFDKRS